MIHIRPAGFTLALSTLLLAGCASQQTLQIPGPLTVRQAPSGQVDDAEALVQADEADRELRKTRTPTRDLPVTTASGLGDIAALPPLGSEPVSVNVENVPIPAFINEVYGSLLGLNVSIDPATARLQELVTLRTAEAQRPRDLYLIAKQVLIEYGVRIDMEGKVLQARVNPRGSGTGEPPLVISGRALPEVPLSHRPVFHLIEPDVVRAADATRWLNTLFGSEIKVQEEQLRNAVLISGRPGVVRQAVDALRVFDRPLMRGRVSIRLEPAFMPADTLADRLIEVLNVQGYSASKSLATSASIMLIPVQNLNSLLVFTTSQESLDFTVSWARELDRPNKAAGSQSIFYYQVKNTKATDISRILGGSLGAASPLPQTTAGEGGAAAAMQQAAASRGGMSGLLVDEARNALIYQGDPSQWERMLTLIRQMDRAPRQVMIEVTIAEVTLDDNDEFGITWFAKNGFSRFNGSLWSGSGSGGTGAGSGGSGLTYLLDVAGQNRFALRAFANDSRVSILSTPRLMVKSGSQGNIDIGTEVPILSMQTTSNQQTEGTTNLLQSIQYRKTGIILSITPTVYSDNRIDLDIQQEVSEAMPASEDDTISSPSIFNRSLSTSLSLRDGGSVVMAGLMSDRATDTDGGIPLLKDVPVLGNLFKSKTKRRNKTELVLMVVPYIVESDDHAQAVSQSIIDRFELLDLESSMEAQRPLPPSIPVQTTRETIQ